MTPKTPECSCLFYAWYVSRMYHMYICILSMYSLYYMHVVNACNQAPKQLKPKIMFFQKMAGNDAKRCALMRWSFFLLNEIQMSLFNRFAHSARPDWGMLIGWLVSWLVSSSVGRLVDSFFSRSCHNAIMKISADPPSIGGARGV